MNSHQRLTLINEKLQSIQEGIPGAEYISGMASDVVQAAQDVKASIPYIKGALAGAAIATPPAALAGFAGRKVMKAFASPFKGVAKLGLYGAAKGAEAGTRLGLKGAKVGGKLALKGAKKGSKIARRVATRINDTLLTGRDRKFKQNIQDPVVRTTGKALRAAGRGISKAAGVVRNRVRGMMRDGVEYEDLLAIHEEVRKRIINQRLKGPKEPLGPSNRAIHPSGSLYFDLAAQTPTTETPPSKIGTGQSGVGVEKQRGSSAEGRRNLIRAVVELSKRPPEKARDTLRSLAKAYDASRRKSRGID